MVGMINEKADSNYCLFVMWILRVEGCTVRIIIDGNRKILVDLCFSMVIYFSLLIINLLRCFILSKRDAIFATKQVV